MASSLALRRTISLFRRLRVAPAAINRRFFNTDAQVTPFNEDDRRVEVSRRNSFPTFFSDPFDPFSPTRSLSQMLNMMDRFLDGPFPSVSQYRGWDLREDEKALHLRVDMPGFDKDHVKVSVEQNTLVIKGQGEREFEDEEYGRRFSSRIDLPGNSYKLNEIKAEMKNGVLNVVVPKVEEEHGKYVFEVSVQ